MKIIGTTKHALLMGNLESSYELSYAELYEFVGTIKYPNGEHRQATSVACDQTKADQKIDRCIAAVNHITQVLFSASRVWSARNLFGVVSQFEGYSDCARIFQVGYNRQTGNRSQKRIDQSRRKFYKEWCEHFGTLEKVPK